MKIYVYDGSFEGLLTAIFYSYKETTSLDFVVSSSHIPNLIDEYVTITTENDKFNRLYNSIDQKLSSDTLKNVYYLYLSEIEGSQKLIYDYLKLCFKHSSSINLAKNNDIIALVDKYVRRVSLEAHRYLGFVRFREITPGIFYSAITPDHNILSLIMNNFVRRFSDQYFMIHDLNRNMAIVYDLQDACLKEVSPDFNTKLSQTYTMCDSFEELFKTYYHATTIRERTNPRQQKSYMPTRYWKHIFEVN
ncbi:MAG: TIGR03915 family putative DNA repair protein [Cellulosilyticaceae bacterium]